MNTDLIIQFIVDNFYSGSDIDQLVLAKFINLSKDDQTMQIKLWAQERVSKVLEKKVNLDTEKAIIEARLNAELLELNKITK